MKYPVQTLTIKYNIKYMYKLSNRRSLECFQEHFHESLFQSTWSTGSQIQALQHSAFYSIKAAFWLRTTLSQISSLPLQLAFFFPSFYKPLHESQQRWHEWGDKMAVLAKPTYQPGDSHRPAFLPAQFTCVPGQTYRSQQRLPRSLSSGLRGRPDAFVKVARQTA